MSLKDPQRVAISENTTNKDTAQIKSHATISQKNGTPSQQNEESTKTDENFALPQSLKQYFVITPCKLRLVVLLILILSKCKVRNRYL